MLCPSSNLIHCTKLSTSKLKYTSCWSRNSEQGRQFYWWGPRLAGGAADKIHVDMRITNEYMFRVIIQGNLPYLENGAQRAKCIFCPVMILFNTSSCSALQGLWHLFWFPQFPFPFCPVCCLGIWPSKVKFHLCAREPSFSASVSNGSTRPMAKIFPVWLQKPWVTTLTTASGDAEVSFILWCLLSLGFIH